MARKPLHFEPVEESTRPGLESLAVRKLRNGDSHNGEETDPWITLGRVMVELILLQKQVAEGFDQVTSLNNRLGRIEKLLYGAAGSALLTVAQFVANWIASRH